MIGFHYSSSDDKAIVLVEALAVGLNHPATTLDEEAQEHADRFVAVIVDVVQELCAHDCTTFPQMRKNLVLLFRLVALEELDELFDLLGKESIAARTTHVDDERLLVGFVPDLRLPPLHRVESTWARRFLKLEGHTLRGRPLEDTTKRREVGSLAERSQVVAHRARSLAPPRPTHNVLVTRCARTCGTDPATPLRANLYSSESFNGVEPAGLEPATSAMPWQRSPN
jgi:hypothetical protein